MNRGLREPVPGVCGTPCGMNNDCCIYIYISSQKSEKHVAFHPA